MACTWAEWGVWGSCSRSCGGGIKQRIRTTSQEALHGGAVCSGEPTGIAGCNAEPCPADPAGNNCHSDISCWFTQTFILNHLSLQLTAPIRSGRFGEAAQSPAEKGLGWGIGPWRISLLMVEPLALIHCQKLITAEKYVVSSGKSKSQFVTTNYAWWK